MPNWSQRWFGTRVTDSRRVTRCGPGTTVTLAHLIAVKLIVTVDDEVIHGCQRPAGVGLGSNTHCLPGLMQCFLYLKEYLCVT